MIGDFRETRRDNSRLTSAPSLHLGRRVPLQVLVRIATRLLTRSIDRSSDRLAVSGFVGSLVAVVLVLATVATGSAMDTPLSGRDGESRVNWRYQHTLLAAAFLANFTNNAARLVISPVVPNVIDTFEVSKSAVGLALTGMWAVYALLQFPSGVVARIGDYRVIVVSLALTFLGSLLLALSPTFFLFGIFVICLGAGAGLYFIVGTSMLTKAFHQRGQVLGIHSAAGPAAGFVTPVVAAFVAVRYGWRPALLVGAALALPALAVFLDRIQPIDVVESSTRDGPAIVATAFSLLKRPSVLYMTFVGVATAYTWQSFTAFFPTFLVEYRGLSIPDVGLVFGVVFCMSAVTQPLYGRLSDRTDRGTVLALVLSLAAVGFGTLVVADRLLVTAVGVFVLGLGFGGGGLPIALHGPVLG